MRETSSTRRPFFSSFTVATNVTSRSFTPSFKASPCCAAIALSRIAAASSGFSSSHHAHEAACTAITAVGIGNKALINTSPDARRVDIEISAESRPIVRGSRAAVEMSRLVQRGISALRESSRLC